MNLADAPQIQVPFTIPATDTLGAYSDTLFYTAAEYEALTPDELAAAEQARYQAWVTTITTPPPPPPPPPTPQEAIALVPVLLLTAQEKLAEHEALLTQHQALVADLGSLGEQLAHLVQSAG